MVHIHLLMMHGFINITSMATPSVAGAAAILVQYLNEGGYDESIEVKASLIKAMLVHSSVTLKGYCTPSLYVSCQKQVCQGFQSGW